MEPIPWGAAVHRPQRALRNSAQMHLARRCFFILFDRTFFLHYIGN
jgi:hypothetical protein